MNGGYGYYGNDAFLRTKSGQYKAAQQKAVKDYVAAMSRYFIKS